jgi:hypothetical protein
MPSEREWLEGATERSSGGALRLAFADHAAAEFACTRWHYAGVLPTGKLVIVGVWEDEHFKGVVIFSRGASPHLGRQFDLDHTEVCELTRVALREHDAPVSKIVAIALRFLKRSNPGLRLVVSFADPSQDHVGGIYQAGNWIFTGQSASVVEYFVGGRWRHKKGVYYDLRESGRLATTPTRTMPGKYRYEMPLDSDMRELVELRRRPYPKRAIA